MKYLDNWFLSNKSKKFIKKEIILFIVNFF